MCVRGFIGLEIIMVGGVDGIIFMSGEGIMVIDFDGGGGSGWRNGESDVGIIRVGGVDIGEKGSVMGVYIKMVELKMWG